MKSVNLYKFSDLILQERYIKEHLYLRRMHETEEFLKEKETKEEGARRRIVPAPVGILDNGGTSPLGT